MPEFDLIRRYFTRATPGALLGVGDDAALLQVSAGNVLAVSSDMLVSGTHFFADTDPFMLGHKTLAVNLSDMAAMGALPRWATLAIALPDADEAWLEKFSAGFFALARQYGVGLVGGDTTRGPLNLCVTIMGEVPQGGALLRSGARPNDEIWVSGCLGDAALALAHLQGRVTLSEAEFAACVPALHQPQPRVALGMALRGIAHSAIDISDGLLADLGHVLDASQVGAAIGFDALPMSKTLCGFATSACQCKAERYSRAWPAPTSNDIGTCEDFVGAGYARDALEDDAVTVTQQCLLSGGDDYELCFTAPAMRHAEILDIGIRLELPLTRIGEIVAGHGCIVHDASGNTINVEAGGYDHFL